MQQLHINSGDLNEDQSWHYKLVNSKSFNDSTEGKLKNHLPPEFLISKYVSQIAADLSDKLYIALITKWNGDIFWSPASMDPAGINKYGDEVRSVFGPIPDGNCGTDDAKIIPVEVDGNLVDLRPNPAKIGHPLEFAHIDPNGNILTWSKGVPRCDKPSLAGASSFCGVNSRIGKVIRGNVEWTFFCRKSSTDREVSNDQYWQRSDPRFALYGAIGYNRATGEIAFFDGTKELRDFRFDMQFIPPGGRSYSDFQGREQATRIYDSTFVVPCHRCHDNKGPYVVDPHIGLPQVGYFLGSNDRRALAFGLKSFLNFSGAGEGSPFRIIGSDYTAEYSSDIEHASTVADPSGNCTDCHTLTTQTSGRRFAADAVGRSPWITAPSLGQFFQLQREIEETKKIADHRTKWADFGGDGMIYPWMRPLVGNHLANLAPNMNSSDWQKLSDCIWQSSNLDCGYQPLYTECPAPESAGEDSSLTNLSATLANVAQFGNGIARVLRITWQYDNSYGDVVGRDDVRMNVAIREEVAQVKSYSIASFPSLSEVWELSRSDRTLNHTEATWMFQDVAYRGHVQWTVPMESESTKDYELDVPAICGRRYYIRIVPKRYCFDKSVSKYSDKNHIAYVDVRCN